MKYKNAYLTPLRVLPFQSGIKSMYYETKDLYLSGYLIAMNLPLDSHTKINGNTIFRFVQTDKLKEFVNQYYNMSSLVNPQKYGSALKVLKNVLYQSTNHNNDDRPTMPTKERNSR